MNSRASRADRIVAWFVFLVFLLLTLLATWYVWTMTRRADRARFDNAVQATRDTIQARVETYVNLLSSTRAMIDADPELTRPQIRRYIRALGVSQRYPGIQGVGITLRVSGREKEQLEQQMRGEGFPQFRVWPETPRETWHSIVVLEPLDRRNLAAIGYDMSTSPVRRSAMDRARDSGMAAVSGRVTLVQEIEARKQPGFLIYMPFYAGGVVPPTVEARRQLLLGYVYAPFRAHDLLTGIFGSQKRPEVGFEIWSGGKLLYRTGTAEDPRFTAVDRLRIADGELTVRWLSQRSGKGGALQLAVVTFLGGIAIAILLFLLLSTQIEARAHAELNAARLRESEAELQRANRAKDDFLATLSHELRTPMTSIMGWAQLLSEETLDSETSRSAIDAIRQGALVQAQLIDDLLDVSRITAGKMRIDAREIQLEPVVAASIETVRPAAVARDIRLIAELDPTIWVRGDAHRLQQVFWNLLTNAVKFTPAGGEVRIIAKRSGAEAVIEVRDTGHGIAPSFLPHVFERFRQEDGSATRTHAGLGIGLAIVHYLTGLHAGSIEAESEGLGRGATFRVRLPLLIGERWEEERRVDDGAGVGGLRVLVVDDDADVRHYIVTVLRSAGAVVESAGSVSAAVRLLGEEGYDVVLTDLAMPREDGFDLLAAIRSAADPALRSTPVVALTAFAMPEERQRAGASGFQRFLAKPIDPVVLRRVVAECAPHRGA